ncbi:furin-like isoform X2 [Apostichopus japonicus]|uniref:furin-like isoform X2 n=1 Tax=Stichopus japonicus TaxID=307972 RepID=UPI003AB70475
MASVSSLIAIATVFLFALCAVSSNKESQDVFTNTYAVHIHGGAEMAHRLAKRHDFVNLGEIVPDHYHFWDHRNSLKRSLRETSERHHLLRQEPEVRWIEQQTIKSRMKRDYVNLDAANLDQNIGPKIVQDGYEPHFNDERWSKVWYLERGNGLDMNVLPAWQKGFTGKGVVVSILDDGIEKNHPDLMNNYDPEASFDLNCNDADPQPRYEEKNMNRHGTRCSGEVAAEANNSICSVGVAHKASIGGVRMLDGDVTDAVEGRSLSLNPQHIDIYSASWGPDDDGKTVDGPGKMAKKAFLDGVTSGRGGLGSIFVWASGNGGRSGDSCGCDGYTNSVYTISVSSATEHGKVPWYSEKCASTLATTYSSGAPDEKQVVTTDLRKQCTDKHSGTSASAPLAAGLCALALEANPTLTWRDLQHIIVATSRPGNLLADDWIVNGADYRVSHSFGFGLMDAAAMVDLARSWQRVPDQHVCSTAGVIGPLTIPASGVLRVTIDSNGCLGEDDAVQSLEHVISNISIQYSKRGDLEITLTSPSGTKSILLPKRSRDFSDKGFHNWEFLSTHSWGEVPKGIWTLEIKNTGAKSNKGVLSKWDLVLYGTEVHPIQKHSGPQICPSNQFLETNVTKNSTIAHECVPCHESCKTCYGRNNSQCIQCQYNFMKRDVYCITNVSLLSDPLMYVAVGVIALIIIGLLLIAVLAIVMRNNSSKRTTSLEYSKLLEVDENSSDEDITEYKDEVYEGSKLSSSPMDGPEPATDACTNGGPSITLNSNGDVLTA